MLTQLTSSERTFLRSQGYNPNNFVRLKKSPYDYEFIQKETGKKLTLRR